jgi:ribonucleoside-diphosphate reductase beta chain
MVAAIGVIDDAFQCYEVVPFGLVADDFMTYALAQFSKRLERIERARGRSQADLEHDTQQVIDADDG